MDRLLDEALVAAAPRVAEPAIEDRGSCEPFEYRRPDGEWETFDPAFAHVVAGTPPREVVVGFTRRHAWGAERRRAIVFDATGLPHAPDRWYPWAELAETDDGRFAAPIPNPSRPRAHLKDGDPLPPRIASDTVARLDSLIESVENGPSLRLVLEEDDRVGMVRHAHWAASLRGRS